MRTGHDDSDQPITSICFIGWAHTPQTPPTTIFYTFLTSLWLYKTSLHNQTTNPILEKFEINPKKTPSHRASPTDHWGPPPSALPRLGGRGGTRPHRPSTAAAAHQAQVVVPGRLPRRGVDEAEGEPRPPQTAEQERDGRGPRRAEGVHRARIRVRLAGYGSWAVGYLARFGTLLRR